MNRQRARAKDIYVYLPCRKEEMFHVLQHTEEKRQFVEYLSTHHGTHLSSFTVFRLVSAHFLAILHIFLENIRIND